MVNPRILLLLAVTLLSTISCTTASIGREEIPFLFTWFSDENLSESWPESCRQFKKEYLRNALDYLKFERKPAASLNKPVSFLDIQGIRIPVPQITFRKIGITQQSGAITSVILSTGKDRNDGIFLLGVMAFAMSEENGTLDQATKDFFGASSFAEVHKQQFTVSPDDLKCDTFSKDDLRTALLLVNKLIIKPVGIAKHVYDLGDYRGYLMEVETEIDIRWIVDMTDPSDAARTLTIHLLTPKGSGYESIGLLFGADSIDRGDSPPLWLQALNDALRFNDALHWKGFLAEAQKAGFDNESLEKVARDNGIVQ